MLIKKIKEWFVTALLICPDGIAIAIIGVLLELLYRVCVYFGFLGSELNYFALTAGFTIFSLLIGWRLICYVLRKK